jgi:DNA (cytosine-5)-methyltransferase 1
MGATRKIAVDLFSGVGGMTLGFEKAGFDVVASVDIDPVHCLTHHYNFPFWTAICTSIRDVSAQDIRNNSVLQNQEIDVVFGGPPCQGFSLIGKRDSEDKRNILIEDFLRLVVELQPKYFVMENVRGIALGRARKKLQTLVEEFANQGYQVKQPYQVLNAAHYGIPQNRERLFLLGCRQGFPLPDYPPPLSHPQRENNLVKTPTVREALQDLPEVNDYPELLNQDSMPTTYGEPSDYGKLLRGEVRSPDDFSYPRAFNPELLTSSKATQHTPESQERFTQTLPGTMERVSRFYRLAPDKLAPTLRAGTPSNRGAFTAPRPIHYATPRCITVREAARLHSYPDWFRFHVTKWHGFRQIGNSVPPLLAQAVAQEIMKVLAAQPEPVTGIYRLGDPTILAYNTVTAARYFGVSPQIVGGRVREKS